MESPEDMQAWVKAHNATLAVVPAMAAAKHSSKKKSPGAFKGTMSAEHRKRKHTTSQ